MEAHVYIIEPPSICHDACLAAVLTPQTNDLPKTVAHSLRKGQTPLPLSNDNSTSLEIL